MKFVTEQFLKSCSCRSAGECTHNRFAEMDALDALLTAFTERMRRKLRRAMAEGRSGWDDPAWIAAEVDNSLRRHVEKGDPVDIANIAMFKWNGQL